MAKVIQGKWLPGETPFGAPRGIIGLGSRESEETPLPEGKTGSTTAPVAANASNEIENWLLKTAQEQIANEAAQSSTDKQGQTLLKQ